MNQKRFSLFYLGLAAALIFSSLGAVPAAAAGNPQGEDVDPFCSGTGDYVHPVAQAIADNYDTTYEQIMTWFCGEEDQSGQENHGLGQIMLALQTAETSRERENAKDPAQFLQERAEGKSWGQIWQEEGLIGKDRARDPGKPDHAGPPQDTELPDTAGPKDKELPDTAGPKDKELPDTAGPKDKDK
ncbi:MAG: hypothetical protein U5K99_08660 [Anaerolineales bacterium]|nr:hypothetical protein [Anaerolineales bacterium]